MSFALKKIVFSVTMACFVLAGQGVASAKTAAKDPVAHAIAKAKGKKVQKPAAKKKVASKAKATGRRVASAGEFHLQQNTTGPHATPGSTRGNGNRAHVSLPRIHRLGLVGRGSLQI